MDAGRQVKSVPGKRTLLGSSSTGSPVMTRVQLPIGQIIEVDTPPSFTQVPSKVCKDEKCEHLPDSPERLELPSRCSRSNLSGLPEEQPPADQMFDGSTPYISLNQSGGVQFIPYQQRYGPFTMSRGNPCPGTPMMHCAVHSRDAAQSLSPATTGDMSAYQIRSPTSGLSPPGSLPSPQQLSDEASRKRELRLMKNREAARECRRKKKEYVKCLENRVAVLERQNKTLIEELKALKDLVAAKECRRRKKQYVQSLENRLAMTENQNKKLKKDLEYLKTMCGMSTSC